MANMEQHGTTDNGTETIMKMMITDEEKNGEERKRRAKIHLEDGIGTKLNEKKSCINYFEWK